MNKLLVSLMFFSGVILAMDIPDLSEQQLQEALEKSALEYAMKESQTNASTGKNGDAILQQVLEQSALEKALKESLKSHSQKNTKNSITEKFVPVFAQLGNTCGLRAVNNISLIYNRLQGMLDTKQVSKALKEEILHGFTITEQNAQEIFKAQGAESYDEQDLLELQKYTSIPYNSFFVIAHSQDFLNNKESYHRWKELKSALDKFKISTDTTLTFLVGSIPLSNSGTSGGYGHWIGIVARKKDGHITLFVADSIVSKEERHQIKQASMISVIYKLLK